MSKLTRITLENLTAFAQLEEDFSPGINVLIGDNGTGKTHLLKTLYAACAITLGEDAERGFGQKLAGVFRPYEGQGCSMLSISLNINALYDADSPPYRGRQLPGRVPMYIEARFATIG